VNEQISEDLTYQSTRNDWKTHQGAPTALC